VILNAWWAENSINRLLKS